MKKMALIIAIVAILVTAMAACSLNSVDSEIIDGNSSMFVIVEDTVNWYIVYHKDTKVMYAVIKGSNGDFTLLVDSNGKPLLWRGE